MRFRTYENIAFLSTVMRRLQRKVALQRKRRDSAVFNATSGPGGNCNFPYPRAVVWLQRVDKMALYNFKKIMVVPTAKVSFILYL